VVAANPHLGAPISYFGASLERARVVAIVLHGRNHDPSMMDDMVVRRLALDRVAYVAPAAADRSWYPAGFMAPSADNEPALSFAFERVSRLVEELAMPVALIGFSQGACLACAHVYRRRDRRGVCALVAFTGGLIGPPGTRWCAGDELADVPVLIAGSLQDPWVPASRMRETADVFAGLGARVATRFYDGTDHVVSDVEIAAARELLEQLGA
jgi:phospholipase/carboxylesterase